LTATSAAEAGFPARTRLRLSVFGDLRVAVEGRAEPALSPKARATLCLLALAPEGRMPRAAVASLLWPGARDGNARVALRQCLRGLREALAGEGFDGLEAGRDALALDLRRVGSDAGDVLAAAAAGVAHPALLGGVDPFAALLADATGLGPAFAAWRTARADALRAEVRRGLTRALALAEGPAERLDLARAIWAVDPLGEGAARALMGALAQNGEAAAAMEVYDTLWRRLDEARDAEPSEETQALLERLKRGEAPDPAVVRRPAAGGGGREGEVRIAIPPPFEVGDRPGARAIAALMRAEIAARLAAFSGLVALWTDGGVADADAELQLALTADGAAWRAGAMLIRVGDGAVLAAARTRLDGAAWEEGMEAAALRLAAGVVAGLRAAGRTAPGIAWGEGARAAANGVAQALGPLLQGGLARPPTGRGLAARAIEEGRPSDAGEAAAAAALAAAAVDIAPLSPDARRDAAWAALILGDFADAADGFSLTAAMNPADAEGLGDAALGLALCGRAAEARMVLHALSALDPGARTRGWRAGMAALALGEAPSAAAAHPAEPLLLTAWRAAALARAGDPAARAMAARLRGGEPQDALAARLAAALPHAEPGWAQAMRAALHAALTADRV
jgi:DNA-binding SARP family transcriptional activator